MDNRLRLVSLHVPLTTPSPDVRRWPTWEDRVMTPPDHFGPEVAAEYDDPSDPRWTGERLEVETTFLAELAGPGGRALELAIGTGRIALPPRRRGIDVHGIDLSAQPWSTSCAPNRVGRRCQS